MAAFKINFYPVFAERLRQGRVFCSYEQNAQNYFYFQKLIIPKMVAIITFKDVNAIKKNRGIRKCGKSGGA
jgi:hypothetical protein